MFGIVVLRVALVLTAVFFTSCSDRCESVANDQPIKWVKNEIKPDSLTNTDNSLSKSPEIVRTAVPAGWYGYAPDSFQVSQYIRRIFQDSNGNLWFGTVGDGVCRYNGSSLTYYTTLDGFSGNSVQGITEDAVGNVWFGTSGGISRYDGTAFTNFTVKDGLPDNSVLSLFADHSGIIWVGTDKGIGRYDPRLNKNQVTFTVLPVPGSGTGLEIKCITQDKTGNLWFASNGGGIWRYNGTSLQNVSTGDGLSDNAVNWIMEDKTGNLWLGTYHKGVDLYDVSAGLKTGAKQFIHFTEENGLCSNWRIVMIFQDKAGHIWVSANGRLCRINNLASGGKSFTTFTAADGLTNSSVQSIYEDRSGNFWFGTGAGLFLFDPLARQGKSFTNVTKKGPWPKYL